METLAVSIVTPYGEIYNDVASYIAIPGSEGEFGVYPGHCNLLATLKDGVIELVDGENKTQIIAINHGYAEVSPRHVNIIVDNAVYVGGDDQSQMAKSLKEAKELLSGASVDDSSLAFAISRLDAKK